MKVGDKIFVDDGLISLVRFAIEYRIIDAWNGLYRAHAILDLYTRVSAG